MLCTGQLVLSLLLTVLSGSMFHVVSSNGRKVSSSICSRLSGFNRGWMLIVLNALIEPGPELDNMRQYSEQKVASNPENHQVLS